jgi:4-hydroxybenzoate polyprenyltransferase
MLYSAPPFRLKRFLGLATLLVSSAALLIFFIGYSTLHPNHSLAGLPLSLVLYLGLAYLVMLPLKDFKDVLGDTKDHIYTLPVILGVERAKTFMSSISFLVFMSSIFILHTPQLLLWAFLFGSVSFWLIQRAGAAKSHIRYKDLMGIFVALAFVYGLGLALFLL